MCAGQLTKNVLPGGSAEPVGAHWDGKITNEWSNGNETWPNITKLKHVQNDENVMFCRKRKNILCVLRQVMQSANCELARRLKMGCVSGSAWDAVLRQVKAAVNEKRTVMLS